MVVIRLVLSTRPGSRASIASARSRSLWR